MKTKIAGSTCNTLHENKRSLLKHNRAYISFSQRFHFAFIRSRKTILREWRLIFLRHTWSILNRVARALCQFKFAINCLLAYEGTHDCPKMIEFERKYLLLCVCNKCNTVWLAQSRADFVDRRFQWRVFLWRSCNFSSKVSVFLIFRFCFTCVLPSKWNKLLLMIVIFSFVAHSIALSQRSLLRREQACFWHRS